MKKIQKQPDRSGKNLKKTDANPNRNTYFYLFLILLITLICFSPVFKNEFINFDDDKYILTNNIIKKGNLGEIFSSYVVGNYHPFTILTYSIQYKLFGIKPGGYHAINLFIHMLNTVLVFYLVFYLTKKITPGLIASLLFGIHTIHVESVAWASELKDVLYTCFFLLSFIYYLRYSDGNRSKFYIISIVMFLFSLLSKAMAAPLPLLFLLADYLKERKWSWKLIKEKIPFLILSLVFGIIAIGAQQSSDAFHDIMFFSLPERFIIAGYCFIIYLLKIIAPLNLSAYYPYPPGSETALPGYFYAGFIAFILLASFIIYSKKFSRKLIFAFGFFLLTTLLILQILPVGGAMMADRYAYVPSIAVFYLAGIGFQKVLENKKYKTPSVIFLVLISIFYATQTYSRCKIWNNSMTLWNDVISKYKNVPVAYNNRGILLKETTRYDEMLNDFSKAIALKTDFADAYNNRGNLYNLQQKYKEAIEDFNKAIQLRPDMGELYNNRGISLYNSGRKSEGCNDFQKALQLGHGKADYLINTFCK
jgi:tetratricopeptide (TPR) repeat protein